MASRTFDRSSGRQHASRSSLRPSTRALAPAHACARNGEASERALRGWGRRVVQLPEVGVPLHLGERRRERRRERVAHLGRHCVRQAHGLGAGSREASGRREAGGFPLRRFTPPPTSRAARPPPCRWLTLIGCRGRPIPAGGYPLSGVAQALPRPLKEGATDFEYQRPAHTLRPQATPMLEARALKIRAGSSAPGRGQRQHNARGSACHRPPARCLASGAPNRPCTPRQSLGNENHNLHAPGRAGPPAGAARLRRQRRVGRGTLKGTAPAADACAGGATGPNAAPAKASATARSVAPCAQNSSAMVRPGASSLGRAAAAAPGACSRGGSRCTRGIPKTKEVKQGGFNSCCNRGFECPRPVRTNPVLQPELTPLRGCVPRAAERPGWQRRRPWRGRSWKNGRNYARVAEKPLAMQPRAPRHRGQLRTCCNVAEQLPKVARQLLQPEFGHIWPTWAQISGLGRTLAQVRPKLVHTGQNLASESWPKFGTSCSKWAKVGQLRPHWIDSGLMSAKCWWSWPTFGANRAWPNVVICVECLAQIDSNMSRTGRSNR